MVVKVSRQVDSVINDKLIGNIIDSLPDPTFAVDMNGRVIIWNKAIEDMTGVTAVDILGKGNYQYALPFYGERRPMLVDLIIDKTGIVSGLYPSVSTERNEKVFEKEVPSLKGKKVYIRCKATPLVDKEGKIIGAIESIEDMTERKKTEQALCQSIVDLRKTLEGTVHALAVVSEKRDLYTAGHQKMVANQ